MFSRKAFSDSINTESVGLEDSEAHLAGGGIDISCCPGGAMVAELDANGRREGVLTQLTSRDESEAPGETKKYRYKSVKVPSRRIPGLIRTRNGIKRFKLSLATRHVHLHLHVGGIWHAFESFRMTMLSCLQSAVFPNS